LPAVVHLVGESVGCESEDIAALTGEGSLESVQARAKSLAAELGEAGYAARGAAVKKVPNALKPYATLLTNNLEPDQRSAITARLPKFFYFSDYAKLPGNIDLNELLSKDPDQLTEPEQTARALLRFAGVEGEEFLDDEFESRKSELEAAAIDLSDQVFQYWKQNSDLSVEFDDDLKEVSRNSQGVLTHHRMLDVRLRDHRHGGVTTNFSTRSAGFQWFFSFLAAFSEFENRDERVVVLLDEPGTSLHGDAQRDFLTFIY